MINYKDTLLLYKNFHDAIKNGNLEQVKDLTEKNEDLNLDAQISSVSPIMYCAQNNHWDVFTYLFEHGANLDIKIEPNDWYLAHECVDTAKLNVVKSVLTYCNINVQTSKGITPLMLAIKSNKDEVAQFILETQRANLSLKDSEGNNALHYAAKYNKQDLFIKIVGYGKEKLLNDQNKAGSFPEELLEDELFKENLANLLHKPIRKNDQVIVDKITQELENLTEVNIDFNIEHVDENKKKASSLSKIVKKK